MEWTSANVVPPNEGDNNVCSPLRCCGKKGLFGIPQERRAVAVVISMMDWPGPANGKVAMTRAASALGASREAASTIKMTTTAQPVAEDVAAGPSAPGVPEMTLAEVGLVGMMRRTPWSWRKRRQLPSWWTAAAALLPLSTGRLLRTSEILVRTGLN